MPLTQESILNKILIYYLLQNKGKKKKLFFELINNLNNNNDKNFRLTSPVPEPWKECINENGEIFYFNKKTGESSWEHPLDE